MEPSEAPLTQDQGGLNLSKLEVLTLYFCFFSFLKKTDHKSLAFFSEAVSLPNDGKFSPAVKWLNVPYMSMLSKPKEEKGKSLPGRIYNYRSLLFFVSI